MYIELDHDITELEIDESLVWDHIDIDDVADGVRTLQIHDVWIVIQEQRMYITTIEQIGKRLLELSIK